MLQESWFFLGCPVPQAGAVGGRGELSSHVLCQRHWCGTSGHRVASGTVSHLESSPEGKLKTFRGKRGWLPSVLHMLEQEPWHAGCWHPSLPPPAPVEKTAQRRTFGQDAYGEGDQARCLCPHGPCRVPPALASARRGNTHRAGSPLPAVFRCISTRGFVREELPRCFT